MNIKMVEYIRGVTVKLELRDADMKCIGAAKEAFVNLCTQVEEQALEQEDTQIIPEAAKRYWNNVASVVVEAGRAPLAEYEPPKPEGSSPEVKRRGRPRKNPDVAEDKEPSGESGGMLPSLDMSSTLAGETCSSSTDTSESSSRGGNQTSMTPVNDADLQKYCASLAKHFGDSQKVFDMAKPFLPEGTVARPSNIRDNAQRWAFIEKAQAETGVMYHG
jgi:hypothetical protein